MGKSRVGGCSIPGDSPRCSKLQAEELKVTALLLTGLLAVQAQARLVALRW